MREQIAQHKVPKRATADHTIRQPGAEPDYDVEEDDSYYPKRQPSSAIRYPRQQVIQQGNRRLVVHYDQPPPSKRRGFHWLVYVGFSLMVMSVGWVIFTMIGNWWQTTQDNWHFGIPRTFQIDWNVGHGTPQTPDSHFMAVNLNGTIEVIECPADDCRKGRPYYIITLTDGDVAKVPVTVSFRDVNGDGKVDMIVRIGDQNDPNAYTVILLNNGTQFVSKL